MATCAPDLCSSQPICEPRRLRYCKFSGMPPARRGLDPLTMVFQGWTILLVITDSASTRSPRGYPHSGSKFEGISPNFLRDHISKRKNEIEPMFLTFFIPAGVR